MTIQYHKFGDYYLPNLVIEDTEVNPIGKYGRMRKRYLKERRPVLYSNLLLFGKLFQHLAAIDEACEDRMELLTQQMAEQEGVTEALKASDQMEWVRRMNSIRNRAEEIVLSELVYC
ncbi:MAG: TnpV protein [Oscillospiraceae bacterium]|nr:TnpV protein [Oscillospiraceae bacterium]MBR3474443.1 TnpV protein [Oscillospiraceae bacterium]